MDTHKAKAVSYLGPDLREQHRPFHYLQHLSSSMHSLWTGWATRFATECETAVPFPAAFSRMVDATVLWEQQHHTTTTTSRKSSNSSSTAQLQLHHPASENDPLRRGHQDECHADPSQVVRRRIPHRVVVTQRRKLPPVCSEKAVGTMRKGSENAMGAIRRGGEKAVGHTRKVSANAVEHTRSVQGLRSRLSAGVVGGGGGGVVWGKGGSQTHSSLCSLLSSPLLSSLFSSLLSRTRGRGRGAVL